MLNSADMAGCAGRRPVALTASSQIVVPFRQGRLRVKQCRAIYALHGSFDFMGRWSVLRRDIRHGHARIPETIQSRSGRFQRSKVAASATVRISTKHEVAFGEGIKAVGSHDKLGAWDPSAAPGLTWGEGNQWAVELDLPPGQHDFKLVVVREDGTVGTWEPGSNRELTVNEESDGIIEVVCPWSETTSTMVSLDESKKSSADSGEAAQLEAAEAEAESEGADLTTVEPSQPAEQAAEPAATPESTEPVYPGESERPVGDAQQEDAQNALEAKTEPEGELEEPQPELDQEKPTVPGGAEEWGPAGGGEMGSSDEADLERQERSEVQEQWEENVADAQEAQQQPPQPPAPAPAADDSPTSSASAAAPVQAKEEIESPLDVLDESLDSEHAPATDTPSAGHEHDPATDAPSAAQPPAEEPPAHEDVEAPGSLTVAAADESGSVAEAAASPAASAKFEPEPTPQQAASGALKVEAEGSKVASAVGGPSAQAVFQTDASPSQDTAADASGPPVPLQVLVGILGISAVPVVAWSLYTLANTGCGLPPGPGGAVGAVEGVSYVTLLGIVGWSIGAKATTSSGLPAGPGGILGIAEGLSYLTLTAGAIVLGLQVKNYGYIPSALPDAKCYGDQAPQSASDITKALADVFARLPAAAPQLVDSPSASPSSLSFSSSSSGQGSFSEAAAAPAASGSGSGGAAEPAAAAAAEKPQVVPHQGVDALFEYLEK